LAFLGEAVVRVNKNWHDAVGHIVFISTQCSGPYLNMRTEPPWDEVNLHEVCKINDSAELRIGSFAAN